ncbi:hypothetical protein IEQ34_014500 [Dendrobium chrysotoxum]|uniref:Uncharacterized protein n=1 Tax=Dendrobium chrysotoxum TaxID=161865 RepID=A0AAV7GLU8_DENCH|nr:hypothetical protein IEQ34_014500 [Dendrobium chrysotoxum]
MTSPQSSINTGDEVFPDCDPSLSIAWTTEYPSTTLPNTTCFPSSHGVFAVQMKNCEPFVPRPALAIERIPDGFTTSAIASGEVPTLAHEIGDDSVKGVFIMLESPERNLYRCFFCNGNVRLSCGFQRESGANKPLPANRLFKNQERSEQTKQKNNAQRTAVDLPKIAEEKKGSLKTNRRR